MVEYGGGMASVELNLQETKELHKGKSKFCLYKRHLMTKLKITSIKITVASSVNEKQNKVIGFPICDYGNAHFFMRKNDTYLSKYFGYFH